MCIHKLTFLSPIKIPAQNSEGRREDERRQEEEMRLMSAVKASALLHLPKDFKKEFNGTIGYS